MPSRPGRSARRDTDHPPCASVGSCIAPCSSSRASPRLPSPAVAQRPVAFQAIDAAIEDGIRRHIYPAAVVMVGRRDSILYRKGYGHFTWSNRTTRPDPASTLWDIASLSKVVATASTVAKLVERGTLDLEAPVERYLPEFAGVSKDQVTVRMLLDHTSGLPPYEALYRGRPTISAAREKLLTVPLTRMPGASALYSDLNAMLAAMVVERVAGESFDSVSRQEVFEPLGMRTTLWSPPPPTRRAPSRPRSSRVARSAASSTTRTPASSAASPGTPASSRPAPTWRALPSRGFARSSTSMPRLPGSTVRRRCASPNAASSRAPAPSAGTRRSSPPATASHRSTVAAPRRPPSATPDGPAR